MRSATPFSEPSVCICVCICVCVCVYVRILFFVCSAERAACVTACVMRYGVAMISRLLKNIGLFCRIQSLL